MRADERETVSLGLAQGHSLQELAWGLGRSPRTVSREVARTVTGGLNISSVHSTLDHSRSSLSAAALTDTLGSLALAVRAEPSG